MGVIRAEPARVTDWAAKSIGAVWRAFDLQLTTYAGLLAAIGLVMAYTNSVEDGKLTLETQTIFTRALMWTALAVIAFIVATAFDYRWLKTLVLAPLPLPARAAGPHPRRSGPASAARLAGSRSGP